MMNDFDDVDQWLRDYAPRWRASQPSPLSVDATVVTRLGSARPPRWIAVIATASAMVLLAVGVVAVAGKLTSQPRPSQSSPRPTPTGSEVIAWAALSPTAVQIPTISAAESPDPSRAAGLPKCLAANLTVSSEMVGAMGSRIITVTLASATPCQLAGFPSVDALDASGRTLAVPTDQNTSLDGYTGPVAVSDSTPAVLRIQWSYLWCAVPINVAKLRITLPASSGSFTVDGFGQSACIGSPTPSYRAPIGIGPIQPRDYRPAREATEFNDVTVSLAVPQIAVSPGDTLHFTVNLHAPALHDVPLNPCPDYTIWLKDLVSTRVSYALNCATVPHRDAADNPFLPAGSTVSFAMQVTVPPADGTPRGTTLILRWSLNTKEQTGSSTSLSVA
jgi:hypothetical protein